MKLVPLVIGGVALVAVAYGGYALLNQGPKPAPTAPQAGQPPAPGQARPGGPPGLPPAPVVVALSKLATVPVTLNVIGSAQAYSAVAVKSQVDGQIREVHFRDGQNVKKGDLLFTLDPRPYEAALRQAEANLAKDKALLDKAVADLKRLETLVAKDFTSRANYDTAKANVASLEATIKADEALVEQSRLKLEFAAITAPIDGRVGSILVSAGNLVRANDNSATSTLVLINQIRPIYVQFTVPESSLSEIRARMAAGKISVKAQAPQEDRVAAEGMLTFINNTVDTATGTILLKATFPNEDDRFVPGQFLNVTVELAVLTDAVVVPAAAVQIGQRGHYVYVVKPDSTVELRLVRAGVANEREIVIQDGLKPGERVVTEGQLRLRPGARVAVRPTSGAPPGRATTPNGPPG
ncbi:MAG: efflux RND transporter periplasmic adaptor subunit [Alphaproteobacteria bacterium]